MNWKTKILLWWAHRVMKVDILVTGPEIVLYSKDKSFYE